MGNQDINDADNVPLLVMAVVIEHKLTVKTVTRMEVVLSRLGCSCGA